MSLFVRQGDRLAARKVGGEMVILSADDSSLFVLNEIGTVVWEAADGRTPVHTIADAVCQQYEVDPDTALRDVQEFVEAMAAAGVLVTSAQAVA
jgi:coenzyme PQQ synthesis protein D (PqqD)